MTEDRQETVKTNKSRTPVAPQYVGVASPKWDELVAQKVMSGTNLQQIAENLPPDLTLWANFYLESTVKGVRSNGTFLAQRTDLQRFLDYFQSEHRELDVRRWLPRTTFRFLESEQERGMKPNTVARRLSTVGRFSRWLFSQRAEFFPLGEPSKGLKPPVQEPLRPKCLTDKQVKRVIDAAYHRICRTYPHEDFANFHEVRGGSTPRSRHKASRPIRDYAVLMLLLNAGLRRVEVCELDLDQFHGRHFRQVKCKGNLFRDVLLGERSQRTIHAYLSHERPLDQVAYSSSPALLLPTGVQRKKSVAGRLSPRTINVIIANIEEAANTGLLDSERFRLHPHVLRHTHAYRMLRASRSLAYVQKRLGHQSANYLARYTQMPEGEEEELLDSAEFS